MTNPCQIGFRCPHCTFAEECEFICIYPYIDQNCPEEMFNIIDEVDCPLVDYPSPIFDLLDIYCCFSGGTSPSESRESARKVAEAIKDARCKRKEEGE